MAIPFRVLELVQRGDCIFSSPVSNKLLFFHRLKFALESFDLPLQRVNAIGSLVRSWSNSFQLLLHAFELSRVFFLRNRAIGKKLLVTSKPAIQACQDCFFFTHFSFKLIQLFHFFCVDLLQGFVLLAKQGGGLTSLAHGLVQDHISSGRGTCNGSNLG